MKRFHLFIISAIFLIPLSVYSNTVSFADEPKEINAEVVSVGFYNLENLFDTIDQANNDADFLPHGKMRWTGMKYRSKLEKMAYAISKIGTDITPNGLSVLGVSEVENRGVLEDLVQQPTIANRTYKIIHYDSPDRRGIDVGLLYNPRDFIPTNSKSYYLQMEDTAYKTRSPLVVSGYLLKEKVHIIVNHWPSRYGGSEVSAPSRAAAASLNKHIADSLYTLSDNAKIIIMGDLNDDPFDDSVKKVLNAKRNMEEVSEKGLYNPMWRILDSGTGTLAYRNQWNLFDQIIISKPLIATDTKFLKFWKAEVFNKNFLSQQEGRYKGSPLRTHAGGVWMNGYSDHFPVLIYLIKEKQE